MKKAKWIKYLQCSILVGHRRSKTIISHNLSRVIFIKVKIVAFCGNWTAIYSSLGPIYQINNCTQLERSWNSIFPLYFILLVIFFIVKYVSWLFFHYCGFVLFFTVDACREWYFVYISFTKQDIYIYTHKKSTLFFISALRILG